MQLTSLSTVKWQLRITHSAEDSDLTKMVEERLEPRLFAYLGVTDYGQVYAEFGEAAAGPLETAILLMATVAYEDRKADPLTDAVRAAVRRFRTVGFSGDTA